MHPRPILLFGVLSALCFLACAPDDDSTSHEVYDAKGRLVRPVPTPTHPPNLILIVVDSLRHDAYATPGDDSVAARTARARMPFLSELAARGLAFEHAAASAPWTLPSMMSLFTGLLPSEHGQYAVHADWKLPEAITTYAEILSRAYRYETAAFLNGPWFERSAESLLQGFQATAVHYTLQDERAVARWASRRDPTRPFFLTLHTFDAHDPYGEENHPWPIPTFSGPPPVDETLLEPDVPAREVFRACSLSADARLALSILRGDSLGTTIQRYRAKGYPAAPDPALAEELAAAYWRGVTWTDGLLRKSFAHLEALGLLKDTLVVVTADHGESLGEHDYLGHGLRLTDPVVRIPLVMVGPGPFQGGHRIREQVGLIDVLPTFFDFAGLAPLADTAGRSVMPVLRGDSWCRPVVIEERLTRANTGSNTDAVRVAARTPAWKYVATFDLVSGEVREEAYHLATDPEELLDVADGTGHLPDGHAFDACICPTITALRARIWSSPRNAASEVGAVPYGSAAPRARSLAPAPCAPRE